MRVVGNGTIERLGKNKYRFRFNLGYNPIEKKYRRSPWRTITGTKTEAIRAKEEFRIELEDGLRVEFRNMTFGEYVERFKTTRANLNGISDATVDTEKYLILHLCKYLASVPMQDIDTFFMKDTLAKLAKEDGVSQTRLHDIVAKAKQIFETAIDDGVITKNPMRKIKTPPRSIPNRNSLDVDAARSLLQILDATSLDRNVIAVYIGLATGLRRGEVLALQWKNVNLVHRVIRVELSVNKKRKLKDPKSMAGFRTLSIDQHTATKLSEWKVLQAAMLRANSIQQTADTFVCGTKTGGVCQPDRFSKWFRSFCIKHHYAIYVDEEGRPLPSYRCNEHGVEIDEDGRPYSRVNPKPRIKKHYCGLKFHELRHTQATFLLSEGVPLKVVQERLGHAQGSTTLDLYSHALPGQDRIAADTMGELLAS